MNNNELAQAITDDLNTLKSLTMEIIPAGIYYKSLFKLAWNAFWKLGIVVFLVLLYVLLTAPHSSDIWHLPIDRGEKINDAVIMTILMTLGALIVLLPALTNYYLIQYHLQERLRTGQLLVKKLQLFGWIFWGTFTVSAVFFASYAEVSAICFLLGLAFFISAVVTYFAMTMEFNRAGIGIIFTVIMQWFKSDVRTTPIE